MDFRRVVLISNTFAGKFKVSPEQRLTLRSKFMSHGARVAFPERVEDIVPSLDKLLNEERMDVLLIDGGDGTCHHVLTGLISLVGKDGDLPLIVPLRGGTTNALANDVEVRGPYLPLTDTILNILKDWDGETYSSLPLKKRWLLHIESSEKGVKELFGFILGFGVLCKGVKRYKGMEPKLRNAFAILSEIVTSAIIHSEGEHDYFTPIKAWLKVEDEIIDRDSFLGIIASTLRRLIFRITPFEEVPDKGDGFNFLAGSLPLKEAVRNILELFMGRTNYSLNQGRIDNKRVKYVEIETEAPYFIDGEIHEPDERYHLTIREGPVLKIVAPEVPPLRERARAYFGYEEF